MIKASIFRDVVPPLPGKCELPLEFPIEYNRVKRRFLEHSVQIDDYKKHVYAKPIVEDQNASEWDEFTKDFMKLLSLPYSVFIHDIGDWDDPSNRLIKFKGIVAHYLWEKLKQNDISDTNSKRYLVSEIKHKFLDTPRVNQIKDDVKTFLQDLKRLKLIK